MTANWHQGILAFDNSLLRRSSAKDRERPQWLLLSSDPILGLFILTLLVGSVLYMVPVVASREIVLLLCGVTLGGLFVLERLRLGKGLAAAQEARQRTEQEAERWRLEARLQHNQRIESLGLLSGGFAHELNNLLTVILGNTEVALTIEPTLTVRKLLAAIDKAGRRAARLPSQMLAYCGKAELAAETLDLSDFIKDMAPWIEIAIPERAKLNYNLTSALAARIDPTQIRHVVVHLLINACEAVGGEVGLISIATGVADYSREALADFYLSEDLPQGPYVHLEISDTGCGMDDVTKAKIFDPFYSTKFTGRGLGMAATLGIVRAHGGAIRVASELGCWTSVRLLFPAGETRKE